MSMDRHLYGDMLPVRADVPDSVVVGPGDLMLLCEDIHKDLNKSLRGLSGLTNYAYPMASGQTTSSIGGVTTPFLGIAIDDSPSGSTDTIAIALTGVFELPLVAQAGVTLGEVVQAVQPTGFHQRSQTSASYQVIQNSGGGVSIGYCMKTEAGARTIRVLLRTKFGPGGIIENT